MVRGQLALFAAFAGFGGVRGCCVRRAVFPCPFPECRCLLAGSTGRVRRQLYSWDGTELEVHEITVDFVLQEAVCATTVRAE